MKKLVAIMLCVVLALAALTGCSRAVKKEEVSSLGSETYDEEFDLSVTSFYSLYNTTLGIDYTQDPLYQYVCEKFNVTLDFWAQEDASSAEKVRTWINTGSMPDLTLDSAFNLAEYYKYIEQGLLAPLPDGWEERWPNVAKLVQASGMANLLEVDGKTYAVPHSVFGNFLELSSGVSHTSLWYRKDWAEQVGMSDLGDDYTISISELKEYLEKVADAGIASNPTIGGSPSGIHDVFQLVNGVSTQTWEEEESGFEWVPNSDNFTDAISMEQEWYEAGLIDPDYYNQKDAYYATQFSSGQLAAMWYGGACMVYQEQIEAYLKAFPEIDKETAYEQIGMAALVADDGAVYMGAGYNYWTCSVISPNCDEAKMERILDMLNWFADFEGQISVELGVPNEHWEYDSNGKAVSLLEEGVRYVEEQSGIFELWGYCGDDIAYSGIDPLRDQIAIDTANAIYAVKLAGEAFGPSDTYSAHQSEAKSVYSVDYDSKITEIVCNGADVESEWTKFIEENKSIWEPLLKELNDTYY